MKKRNVSKYKVIENASFDQVLYLSGQILWIEDQNGTVPENWRVIYSESGGAINSVKNEDFQEFSQFIEKI